MEALCKVKLVTPEGVAVTRLQKGVEKDGEEATRTSSFAQGEEDGVKYIKIDGVKYNKQ